MWKSQDSTQKYDIRVNFPVNKKLDKWTFTLHTFNFLLAFVKQ